MLRQQKRLSTKPRTWHYFWDANDRLTGVITPDGVRWRYLYDPLGRRIAKKRLAADGATVAERIDFTWDGMALAEQTHFGLAVGPRNTVWDWEPGGFRPVSQTERAALHDAPQEWVDEQFYAIVTDLIGTPSELVDPTGSVAWYTRTTLWGTVFFTGPGEAYTPLRFPGQYFDPETGLHYNCHRYYDPASARYGTNDPIGLASGPNPHTYVPNPTHWIDPFGLAPDCGEAQRAIPHGFSDADDFASFGQQLNSGLRSAGFDDATAIFQGSAITGHGFRTGAPFDVGRISDFDIALASPSAMSQAQALGFELRSGGMRTGPLTAAQLEHLGLGELVGSLSQTAGRPVNFMLFQSIDAATARGPSIVVPRI
ncbi:MAG: hypothetical protein LC799_05865 [Actinobacteria bacterium]|nr:hypothetical protein [Actinomycetota bacterium]